jgi:hypothetical protein
MSWAICAWSAVCWSWSCWTWDWGAWIWPLRASDCACKFGQLCDRLGLGDLGLGAGLPGQGVIERRLDGVHLRLQSVSIFFGEAPFSRSTYQRFKRLSL